MKNATKASEIIRESWDWHGKKTQEFIINGKKIKTNLCAEWSYYDGMGAPEKYSHVMGGTYFKTRKSSGETLDDLIAEGYDEIRFMLLASGMIRGYCEVYVFASNSTKAKEIRAKERAKREAEKLEQAKAERIHDQILETAQESNSEAQADDQESAPRLQKTSKRLEIAKAEIDKWNRMAESVKGTNSWALFNLWHDGIDHNGKWFALGNDHSIRAHMIPHPSDHYFIKKIKGNTWLYFEDCAGIQERWLLSDLAIAFFLPESSQESSSDNSEEIIKETAEESTESKSEPIEASSAVEFERVSDYMIKASWKGEMIGKITISYKSYSPVNKVYRVNGNMDEKFDSLDDAKMHLIQNFRAQAQEALDQAVDEKTKLNLRNKIDALDDQIADLFIRGAEMRTGKEAE